MALSLTAVSCCETKTASLRHVQPQALLATVFIMAAAAVTAYMQIAHLYVLSMYVPHIVKRHESMAVCQPDRKGKPKPARI